MYLINIIYCKIKSNGDKLNFLFFEALLIQDIFIQNDIVHSIYSYIFLNVSLKYLLKSHETRNLYIITVTKDSTEHKRCCTCIV